MSTLRERLGALADRLEHRAKHDVPSEVAAGRRRDAADIREMLALMERARDAAYHERGTMNKPSMRFVCNHDCLRCALDRALGETR